MRREIGVPELTSSGDRWACQWWGTDGKRHKRLLGRKDEMGVQAARRAVRELQAEAAGRPELLAAKGQITVSQWAERFLVHRRDIAPRTRKQYVRVGKLLADAWGADLPLTNVTRLHAAEWAAGLEGVDYTRRGLVSRASTMMGAAVELDLISSNPFRGVRVAVMPKEEREWGGIELESIVALIAACPSSDHACLIGLTAFAGLRAGEALELTWDRVKKDRLIVQNRKTARTSGRAVREVRLEPELRAMLNAHAKASGREGLVVKLAPHNLRRWMVGYTDKRQKRRYQGLFEKAGVKPWPGPFQSLRKWRSSTWKNLFPAAVVDAWLGHSRVVADAHYYAVPEAFYEAGGAFRESAPDLRQTGQKRQAAVGSQLRLVQ